MPRKYDLKVPFTYASTPVSYEKTQEGRHKYLSPSLNTFQAYDRPFVPTQARMQYLWDHKGQKYLDCLAQNLTISIGHNHPRVIEAVQEQMKHMVHSTTMYYHEAPMKAAEEIIKTLPKDREWKIHFSLSGSESVDLAFLLARSYTKNHEILALRNAYHGLVGSAMGATGLHTCKHPAVPQTSHGIIHIPYYDPLRGPHTALLARDKILGIPEEKTEHEACTLYANECKATIEHSTSGNVAGFIYEKVLGFGGILYQPDEYIKQCAQHVKDAGGLIIADEVQCGVGRLGETFWAFEMDEVVPDIIVAAKGIGNGLPVSFVATSPEIFDSICNKSYFNTYANNPTCVSAVTETFKILKEDGYQEHCKDIGNVIKEMLDRLQAKYPCIAHTRGMGIMHGLEICKPGTTIPDPILARKLFEMFRDQGLIFGLGSKDKNVLRIMGPMCTDRGDVKYMEQVLDYCFEKIGS